MSTSLPPSSALVLKSGGNPLPLGGPLYHTELAYHLRGAEPLIERFKKAFLLQHPCRFSEEVHHHVTYLRHATML